MSAAWSPRAILGVGFAGFLAYAFPGYMSSDSLVQLLEARARAFSPAHPPIMSVIWMVLDAWIAGPILMLILQGTLFLGGSCWLLGRVMKPRRAAIAACAVLLYPPVLTVMGVIWKDSLMAACLVMGTAAVVDERRRTRWIGVGLLAVACGVRHNAFGAAVPLIGLLFEWRPGAPWLRRYLAAGLLCIAVVGSTFTVNRVLATQDPEMAASSGTAVADIVGVLAYTGPRSDAELLELLDGTGLRVRESIQRYVQAHHSPRNSYWATHGDTRLFDPPQLGGPEAAALLRAWRTIIRSDWQAYASHRWAGYHELLGLSDSPLWAPTYALFVESADHPSLIEHDAVASGFQRTAQRVFAWIAANTPLYRAYVYVVLALILLAGFCRDRVTVALLASGLVYELSFLPAAGTPDYRYSHWLVTCTVLTVVILVARRARA